MMPLPDPIPLSQHSHPDLSRESAPLDDGSPPPASPPPRAQPDEPESPPLSRFLCDTPDSSPTRDDRVGTPTVRKLPAWLLSIQTEVSVLDITHQVLGPNDPHAHQPWAPCDHCLVGVGLVTRSNGATALPHPGPCADAHPPLGVRVPSLFACPICAARLAHHLSSIIYHLHLSFITYHL